jgi:hypothetical protein
MVDESLVNGDELNAFDLALSQKESIEWTARRRIVLQCRNDMLGLDRQHSDAGQLRYLRKSVKSDLQGQLAQSRFDGDLPKRSDAEMELRIAIFEHGRDRASKAPCLLFEQANEDMRVQQKLQRQAG